MEGIINNLYIGFSLPSKLNIVLKNLLSAQTGIKVLYLVIALIVIWRLFMFYEKSTLKKAIKIRENADKNDDSTIESDSKSLLKRVKRVNYILCIVNIVIVTLTTIFGFLGVDYYFYMLKESPIIVNIVIFVLILVCSAILIFVQYYSYAELVTELKQILFLGSTELDIKTEDSYEESVNDGYKNGVNFGNDYESSSNYIEDVDLDNLYNSNKEDSDIVSNDIWDNFNEEWDNNYYDADDYQEEVKNVEEVKQYTRNKEKSRSTKTVSNHESKYKSNKINKPKSIPKKLESVDLDDIFESSSVKQNGNNRSKNGGRVKEIPVKSNRGNKSNSNIKPLSPPSKLGGSIAPKISKNRNTHSNSGSRTKSTTPKVPIRPNSSSRNIPKSNNNNSGIKPKSVPVNKSNAKKGNKPKINIPKI